MADVPEINYARSADGVHVAYQVVGDGPPDVVYANSLMSHIEASWNYPRPSASTSGWPRCPSLAAPMTAVRD